MITPLNRGSAWWTTGKKNSRKTALGASAILVVLALITYLIWVSPSDNPVRRLVGDVVKPISTNMQLKNDRANLLSELVSSRSTLSNQSAALAKQKAALAAQLGKNAALTKQLAAAKAQSAKYAGQVKALQASSGGSSTTLASGSSTTGSGTSSTTPITQPGNGTGSNPTGPVTVTTPTKAQLLDPATRYFGLYTAQSPFSFAEFNQVTTDVGVQPNVSGYFQAWNQDFRADAVQASWAKGDLPMMTWESQVNTSTNNAVNQPTYSLPNIIDGKFDAYLTKYADAIAANGQPMAIRLDQEMNATWYPWSEDNGHGVSINGNSTGDFVKMWQHVWNIFQAQGANKYVIWDWSPNRIDQLTASHKTAAYNLSLYPGSQYVDWIGMSGYERPATTGNIQDTTFTNTFGATLALLRQIVPDKKIILSEVGAAEVGPSGGSIKPAWITSFFNGLSDPANSDIIGFSWFNETVTTSSNGNTITNDWRIDSTAKSTAAFAAGIQRTDIGYSLRAAVAQ